MGLTLHLPWPPSANRIWRHIVVGGQARTLLSEDARGYYAKVKRDVRKKRNGFAPLSGPLTLTVKAYPPDRRRRDLDNTLKAVGDALTKAGVWWDDSQLVEIHAQKGSPVPGGIIEVTIETRPEE